MQLNNAVNIMDWDGAAAGACHISTLSLDSGAEGSGGTCARAEL